MRANIPFTHTSLSVCEFSNLLCYCLSTPLTIILVISSAALLTLGGLQATPVLCMVRC